MKFSVGQSVRRKEDVRFLIGQGRYTDDIVLPGEAAAVFVRSPHAHARIVSVDVSGPREMPGVLGVFTAADLEQDDANHALPNPNVMGQHKNRDGSAPHYPAFRPLSGDKVRHVGDRVALVVAQTHQAAVEAAEAVVVEYAVLPALTTGADAMKPGAPLVSEDVPGNVLLDWHAGDQAATAAAFANAAHTVRVDLVNNRVVVASVEPRGAIGAFDSATGRYTLYAGSQGANNHKRLLAKFGLHVPEQQIHVISPDVGGSFGMKSFLYPEYVSVLWAAKKIGRPVKWRSDRSEAFVSDFQARDLITQGELALDADGQFLALRTSSVANVGGYVTMAGPNMGTSAPSRVIASTYTTPQIYLQTKVALTNCVPISAYRGAGRPEANYIMERLIDIAAGELGIDRLELRRRNMIPRDAFPYKTPLGTIYNSGAFADNLDQAAALADWDGFATRREAARARGKHAGIGIATYLEISPAPSAEFGDIGILEDGTIEVYSGSQPNGQGHETAFAQIVSEALDVDFERINITFGDTDLVEAGGGTGGSKSMRLGGNAVKGAVDALIEKGREIASHLLEAASADIEFTEGKYRIAGTDREVSLDGVAQAARTGTGLPQDLGGPFRAKFSYQGAATHPNGCHICELEVTPETGEVEITRYSIVDDIGRVVNPLLASGQVQGGVAQGLGQALFENCVYDPASGQLITGSFMDYCMPRARDIPGQMEIAFNEVLCPTNPLGIKGAGEGGTTGAMPAVISALVDALREFGITHIDMPATPEKIWRIIHGANGQGRAASA